MMTNYRIPTALLAGVLAILTCASCAASRPGVNVGTWRAVNPPQALRTLTGAEPPLLPESKVLYDKNRTGVLAQDRQVDPVLRCLPPGVPRLLYISSPFEFVQRADEIVILYEWNRLVRVVPMNVRQPELIGPSYSGQSVGRWDGGTLTIETIGLLESTFLDATGLPHSDELRLIEEYIPESKNKMRVVLTIDDPKTFSSAWKTTLTFERDPQGRVNEDVCLERSVGMERKE